MTTVQSNFALKTALVSAALAHFQLVTLTGVR